MAIFPIFCISSSYSSVVPVHLMWDIPFCADMHVLISAIPHLRPPLPTPPPPPSTLRLHRTAWQWIIVSNFTKRLVSSYHRFPCIAQGVLGRWQHRYRLKISQECYQEKTGVPRNSRHINADTIHQDCSVQISVKLLAVKYCMMLHTNMLFPTAIVHTKYI